MMWTSYLSDCEIMEEMLVGELLLATLAGPVECKIGIYHIHYDFIKWKHFPCHWPFVRGIHRSPVNSLHKGQWGGALMFSLICAWINGWVNNREAGDLRCHRAHYDVTVMWKPGQSGCRFADDKSNAFYWRKPPVWFIFHWSLFLRVELLIKNKSLLIEVMAQLQAGDKPFPVPMVTKFYDVIWRHQATMS